MDDHLEEDDKTALAGLTDAPPHRKAYSYSQQLRTESSTNYKRHNQVRKHSLDETEILSSQPSNVYSSDEEDLYPPYSGSASINSTATGGGGRGGGGGMGIASGSMSDQHMDYHINLSHKMNGLGFDGALDESQDLPQLPLPEFMGAGGGVGIFKVPTRAAVHPARPQCLELRPHPLRETQGGKFLRTIVCTETQLWAGQESGVRVWNLSDAYLPGTGVGGRVRRGDEDAAPFYESVNISPTICMKVDLGSKLIWSGHKDGRIRSWKMDQTYSNDTPFKEGLSWQAHRGPVLSIAISSYGDMWTGSESGIIKVWPWESIEKSLSLSPEERRMAALLVERSAIDLKSQVTVNGVCSISSSDVKRLMTDNVRAKIWAAGSLSFSLWDTRSKELLKVFNIDGQVENRVDMSSIQEQAVEDEMNVKFVAKTKKEKSQNSFLQRSRNAIMGAADAVRRVASRGATAFAEDNKRTEALGIAEDGTIWTGCSNGLLIQWDGNGTRLRDMNRHSSSVLCFCTYGSKIWVGYSSGMVQVLDLEGNLIASWVAHNGPVIKLVIGNGSIYSLASHGGIRGWNISSPGPIDSILGPALADKKHTYTRFKNIKILVGTWNVGQGRATHDALMSWLGSAVKDVGIVVVGLQEVEMGAGFLAMSAAKETVGLEGSSIGQWWQDHIGKALDEGSTFERTGSRQLAALLIAIWVRKSLRTHVGDLDVGAVACGLGRAIGNKGGVGLRLRVYDRIMCFVNCHFAAHLEAVNRRNADFNHIFRTMTFTRSTNLLQNAAGVSSSAQMLRGTNAVPVNPDDGKPDLAEADFVLFTGDFNYRLFGITYDEARDFVSQRCFDWLREKDQLRAEMKTGKVFQGMREALIRFPPTYKFEKGKPGLGGYDSGEKKRIPAWCDRVLYRDNRRTPNEGCSIECPVVASVVQYEARMDVTESDHKPVHCKLNVDIAHIDRSVRRQEFGKILESTEEIKACLEALRVVPETSVNAEQIMLQNQDNYSLKITNKSGEELAFFQIFCEGQCTIKDDETPPEYRPRGSLGFPRWLEVTPAAGMIKPDDAVEVSIRHEENHKLEELVDGVPQSWWSEDTRDKEVILLVIIKGRCSSETKTHRVSIRSTFSGATVRMDQNNTTSRRNQGGSKLRHANSASDMA